MTLSYYEPSSPAGLEQNRFQPASLHIAVVELMSLEIKTPDLPESLAIIIAE